jgi:Malate:quinone oxidoreductase (Mqo)
VATPSASPCQLWSHLVTKGAIKDPHAFIESCPHMSFVWGEENVAFQVLEKCFGNELAGGWRDKLKTIIPTYDIDLTQDAAACRDIRAQTAAVLGLTNV